MNDHMWDSTHTDCNIDEEATPNSVKSHPTSSNSFHNVFSDKGKVKEGDRERLVEEINVKILRRRRQAMTMVHPSSKASSGSQLLPPQSRRDHSLMTNQLSKMKSEGQTKCTKFAVTDDIKFLLGELVKCRKLSENSLSNEGNKEEDFDDVCITMNDIQPYA